ncbi:hypothetical protein [Mesorhizobium sp. 10J20-29]
MRTLRNAFLIGTVLSVLMVPNSADAQRRARAGFYADTAFGSLAWISRVATRSAARRSRIVFDLSGENCTSVPAKGPQWFLINHSSEDQVGKTGYFSVRILYSFEPDAPPPAGYAGIHLHRNSNWFDANNKLASEEFERDSFQIPLNDEAFIALHSPYEGMKDENLAKLEKAIGRWHMKPTPDQESSWADRHLYGTMLRAYSSAKTGAISARLIRFTPTAGNDSSDPVVFWLDPRGATFATILVEAPRNPGSYVQRVYTIRFDDRCQ